MQRSLTFSTGVPLLPRLCSSPDTSIVPPQSQRTTPMLGSSNTSVSFLNIVLGVKSFTTSRAAECAAITASAMSFGPPELPATSIPFFVFTFTKGSVTG